MSKNTSSKIKPETKKKRTISPELMERLKANLSKARIVGAQIREQRRQSLKPSVKSIETLPTEVNLNKTTEISTVDQGKMGQRLAKRRLERYLDDIQSVKDFEKVRKQNPCWALEFAFDRVYGRPQAAADPTVSQPKPVSVAVLVKVLCGGIGAGTQGIDSQSLTFKVEDEMPSSTVEEKPD